MKRLIPMRRTILLALVLLTAICIVSMGCDRAMEGMEKKEEAEQDTPRISANTIQTAVTGLMLEARVKELDDDYEAVNTREEVMKVTAGNGEYSLYDHLSASYPFAPAFDISRNGKVSVD